MREPATILVRVPNPRYTKTFDHYLFSFAHRGSGYSYCVAAVYKGTKAADACETWARGTFPHSAVDEGRHRWKKVRLLPRIAAARAVVRARAAFDPAYAEWRRQFKVALGMCHGAKGLKKKWDSVHRLRRRYERAKDRLSRAEAMANPQVVT